MDNKDDWVVHCRCFADATSGLNAGLLVARTSAMIHTGTTRVPLSVARLGPLICVLLKPYGTGFEPYTSNWT